MLIRKKITNYILSVQKIFSLVIAMGVGLSAHANERAFVENLLQQVLLNSDEVKVVKSQGQSSLIDSQLELTIFSINHSMTISNTDDRSPAASPFAPNQNESTAFTSSLSKEWTYGFNTSLDLSYSDNVIGFATNPTINFTRTNINLGFKTDLLRDLYGQKNRYLYKSNEANQKKLELGVKNQIKLLLAGSLLDYSLLLERRDELTLQKSLCRKVKKQTDKLKVKNSRGSVSSRDYLLSIKELNSCNSLIDTVQKQIFESAENFKSKYNVDVDRMDSPQVADFFKQVETIYSQFKNSGIPNIESKDMELESLKLEINRLNLKQSELDAKAIPSLAFELKLGSAGLDDGFSDAFNQTTGNDNPYVYMSISSDFPFVSDESKLRKASNRYSLEAAKKNFDFKKKSKVSRYYLLQNALKADFKIYERELRNLKLSNRIYGEALRDFNLGRIDFFALTEFQKGLTQNQQQLARLRTQIVVNTVEFLDYHQFFDRFVER